MSSTQYQKQLEEIQEIKAKLKEASEITDEILENTSNLPHQTQ